MSVSVGIIGAMDEEVAILKEWMTEKQTETIAGCEFTTGKLNGVDVARSGIGKVNAAMSTTILLQNLSPIMVNTGFRRRFQPGIECGCGISTEVRHHDVDDRVRCEYGQV